MKDDGNINMRKRIFTANRFSGRDVLFIILMLLPPVLMVGVFVYYPVILGIPNAFRYYNLMYLNRTRFIGFDNFIKLAGEIEFLQSIPNTILWVFVSLIFQFIIGFTLALFLKKKFKGRGVYQGLIFFPWAVSGFLIGILWRWMYNAVYGPINDLLKIMGLVDPLNPIGFLSDPDIALISVIITNVWYGIAFFVIMIQAALQGVPDELYEASMVDGANKLRQFFSITLPFIKSVLILTTLLRSIWIFNFADLIYALTRGGPGGRTSIMSSYMMNLILFNNDFGMAGAVGLIICVILLIWTIFYFTITRFEEGMDF